MTRYLFTMAPAVCLAFAAAGCGDPATGPVEQQAASSSGEPERTPTGGKAYHGMIQYRAKDAKRAIVEPLMLAPEDAAIAPGTKVIGVFIGGEARAYPLFILNNHQIVNDRVGGIPLSASW